MSVSKLGPLQMVMQKNNKNIGTVLFLHGSGDTGLGALEWIQSILGNFSMPHIKFLFPTAPKRPYTPNGGTPSTVWFDRLKICPEVAEHKPSMLEIGEEIKELIEAEVRSGVPLNKIIVGGFSMGGCLALNVGYRFVPGLAGIFALSSFLNDTSGVYETLRSSSPSSPLFMCHGNKDTLVPIKWGKHTFDNLKNLKVQGEFLTIDADHELDKRELKNLMTWINHLIPEAS